MATSRVDPVASPINHPAQVALPPRIMPNRRQLDDSFPVLGFNIFCDHPAWFEVLLTTDRSLFDPANVSKRTPANFYSSRQDARLIPVQLGTAVYLAPAAVLRGFTTAIPRPQEIFYTVVVYSDAQGANPQFAQPTGTLATSAPSVAISRHYGSDGSLTAFGMDPTKLRHWQPPDMQASGKPVAGGQSLNGHRMSADDDRAGGEDGRGAPAPEIVFAGGPQSLEYDGDQWAEPESYREEAGAAVSYGTTRASALDDDDYIDGYPGSPPPAGNLVASLAQQTSFRAGDPEPEQLQDDADDDGGGGRVYRAAASYSRPAATSTYPTRGAAAYGDEADEGDISYSSQSQGAEAAPAVPPPSPVTIEVKRDLISKLGDYTAVSADAEFNGVLGADHPAYRRYHLGLSFGVTGFNQDRGDLGRLLTLMRERDAAKFQEIFGADAEALVRVTTARGPRSAESRDGRSARVQPVGGADLWQEPWLGRFREAGGYKPFQAAQNRLAAELYLDPMLRFAHQFGFNTERALGIAVDRASQMGVVEAQQWIAASCGPLQTSQQRQQALAALGFEDLHAFQAAHHDLEADGQWGPRTHAALVDALRDSGRSPVPLPTLDQMLDALVRRSAQTPWFARIQALRNDVRFGDTPLGIERHHREHHPYEYEPSR